MHETSDYMESLPKDPEEQISEEKFEEKGGDFVPPFVPWNAAR
jgi:hypothetical protein